MLSSSNFETFTAMTLKLQEVANLGMFFHVMLFMFVYNKNKDTPFCIGCIVHEDNI